MLPWRNPLVWLARLPYRKGYGIHSPYAYGLATQVLYRPGRYYADALLDGLFPRWQHVLCRRRVACHRLLFRLANHYQPVEILLPKGRLTQAAYLHSGCRRARLAEEEGRGYYTLVLADGNRVHVVYDLQRHREEWGALRMMPDVTASFDLYDMALAIADPKLNRQHYKINW
ncbi:MAG: hypothetical protein IJ197_02410 [Bacteroidaceae bacterium]|nr:hypothetical protein [Bacteroidaceae bacterium]